MIFNSQIEQYKNIEDFLQKNFLINNFFNKVHVFNSIPENKIIALFFKQDNDNDIISTKEINLDQLVISNASLDNPDLLIKLYKNLELKFLQYLNDNCILTYNKCDIVQTSKIYGIPFISKNIRKIFDVCSVVKQPLIDIIEYNLRSMFDFYENKGYYIICSPFVMNTIYFLKEYENINDDNNFGRIKKTGVLHLNRVDITVYCDVKNSDNNVYNFIIGAYKNNIYDGLQFCFLNEFQHYTRNDPSQFAHYTNLFSVLLKIFEFKKSMFKKIILCR